ncbi:MAG: hypothetical protein HY043_10725 [Verrucomicrobia bacterium]|nr:hypothetical protein [Verrucomicrobiota bacterium]
MAILSPVNAMGQPVRDQMVRAELSAAFESDKLLGTPNRLRLAKRRFGDPLPIE